MARSEARLHLDLWREGLAGHTAHAKLTYAVVLTEPTVNHAGVGAVRCTRWARNASLTRDQLDAALTDLTAGDPRQAQLVIDEDTEEVLVRTLVRRDRIAEQPYMLKAAISAALQVQSKTIRWVLAAELRKLPPKPADGVSKSGKKIVYPDPHQAADLLDPPGGPAPERVPTPTTDPSGRVPTPIGDPSERVSRGSRTAADQPEPQSEARQQPPAGDPPERVSEGSRHPSEREGGGGRGRGSSSVRSTQVGRGADNARHTPTPADGHGTRIRPDYTPADRMLDWARTECPGIDAARETPAFVDHFTGLAGPDSMRADWDAEWRKWMRREQRFAQERAARNGGRHLSAVAPLDPNRELTNAEVDDILGPESMPMPPAEISDQGVEACKAWAREHDPAWRAARREKAIAKLTARAAP